MRLPVFCADARRRALLVCVSAVAAGALLVPAQAMASNARAYLYLPAVTRAGDTITIRYRFQNIPSSDAVELQRHIVGQPKNRWLNTEMLLGSSGKVHWYAMMARTVYFRVAVWGPGNRYIGATTGKRLIVLKKRRSGGGGVGGGGGSTGGGGNSGGSSNASVSWNISTTATVNVADTFAYSSSGVPSGAAIVAQQQEGTAHVWTTFGNLTGTSGNSQITWSALGQNAAVRLAVVQNGNVLASTATTYVNVFGSVPLATLVGSNANPGTFTTSQATFPYLDFVWGDNFPGPFTKYTVDASSNNCNSVTVDFLAGDSSPGSWDAGDTATVTVVQQSAAAVSSSPAPLNTPGSVTASVIPGQSWSINTSETVVPGEGGGAQLYLNGSAMCDSTKAIITVY